MHNEYRSLYALVAETAEGEVPTGTLNTEESEAELRGAPSVSCGGSISCPRAVSTPQAGRERTFCWRDGQPGTALLRGCQTSAALLPHRRRMDLQVTHPPKTHLLKSDTHSLYSQLARKNNTFINEKFHETANRSVSQPPAVATEIS